MASVDLRGSAEHGRCNVGDVVVTQRLEISSEIYDVEGCRQRARYSCFHERYGAHCVREPDPR